MSAPEVLVPLPATPGAAARPIDGPCWMRGARALETEMVDGRGVRWWVESVEAGGRILHWRGDGGRRKARTEIAADHPDAPSEAAVLAVERERARQTRERRRRA
jgi:predicted nucleic acid-binding Zn ribbon protein